MEFLKGFSFDLQMFAVIALPKVTDGWKGYKNEQWESYNSSFVSDYEAVYSSEGVLFTKTGNTFTSVNDSTALTSATVSYNITNDGGSPTGSAYPGNVTLPCGNNGSFKVTTTDGGSSITMANGVLTALGTVANVWNIELVNGELPVGMNMSNMKLVYRDTENCEQTIILTTTYSDATRTVNVSSGGRVSAGTNVIKFLPGGTVSVDGDSKAITVSAVGSGIEVESGSVTVDNFVAGNTVTVESGSTVRLNGEAFTAKTKDGNTATFKGQSITISDTPTIKPVLTDGLITVSAGYSKKVYVYAGNGTDTPVEVQVSGGTCDVGGGTGLVSGLPTGARITTTVVNDAAVTTAEVAAGFGNKYFFVNDVRFDIKVPAGGTATTATVTTETGTDGKVLVTGIGNLKAKDNVRLAFTEDVRDIKLGNTQLKAGGGSTVLFCYMNGDTEAYVTGSSAGTLKLSTVATTVAYESDIQKKTTLAIPEGKDPDNSVGVNVSGSGYSIQDLTNGDVVTIDGVDYTYTESDGNKTFKSDTKGWILSGGYISFDIADGPDTCGYTPISGFDFTAETGFQYINLGIDPEKVWDGSTDDSNIAKQIRYTSTKELVANSYYLVYDAANHKLYIQQADEEAANLGNPTTAGYSGALTLDVGTLADAANEEGNDKILVLGSDAATNKDAVKAVIINARSDYLTISGVTADDSINSQTIALTGAGTPTVDVIGASNGTAIKGVTGLGAGESITDFAPGSYRVNGASITAAGGSAVVTVAYDANGLAISGMKGGDGENGPSDTNIAVVRVNEKTFNSTKDSITVTHDEPADETARTAALYAGTIAVATNDVVAATKDGAISVYGSAIIGVDGGSVTSIADLNDGESVEVTYTGAAQPDDVYKVSYTAGAVDDGIKITKVTTTKGNTSTTTYATAASGYTGNIMGLSYAEAGSLLTWATDANYPLYFALSGNTVISDKTESVTSGGWTAGADYLEVSYDANTGFSLTTRKAAGAATMGGAAAYTGSIVVTVPFNGTKLTASQTSVDLTLAGNVTADYDINSKKFKAAAGTVVTAYENGTAAIKSGTVTLDGTSDPTVPNAAAGAVNITGTADVTVTEETSGSITTEVKNLVAGTEVKVGGTTYTAGTGDAVTTITKSVSYPGAASGDEAAISSKAAVAANANILDAAYAGTAYSTLADLTEGGTYYFKLIASSTAAFETSSATEMTRSTSYLKVAVTPANTSANPSTPIKYTVSVVTTTDADDFSVAADTGYDKSITIPFAVDGGTLELGTLNANVTSAANALITNVDKDTVNGVSFNVTGGTKEVKVASGKPGLYNGTAVLTAPTTGSASLNVWNAATGAVSTLTLEAGAAGTETAAVAVTDGRESITLNSAGMTLTGVISDNNGGNNNYVTMTNSGGYSLNGIEFKAEEGGAKAYFNTDHTNRLVIDKNITTKSEGSEYDVNGVVFSGVSAEVTLGTEGTAALAAGSVTVGAHDALVINTNADLTKKFTITNEDGGITKTGGFAAGDSFKLGDVTYSFEANPDDPNGAKLTISRHKTASGVYLLDASQLSTFITSGGIKDGTGNEDLLGTLPERASMPFALTKTTFADAAESSGDEAMATATTLYYNADGNPSKTSDATTVAKLTRPSASSTDNYTLTVTDKLSSDVNITDVAVNITDSGTSTTYVVDDNGTAFQVNGTASVDSSDVVTKAAGVIIIIKGDMKAKAAGAAYDISSTENDNTITFVAGNPLSSTKVNTRGGMVTITESSNTTDTQVFYDGHVTGIDGNAAITGLPTGQTVSTTGNGSITINGTKLTLTGSSNGAAYAVDDSKPNKISSITGLDENEAVTLAPSFDGGEVTVDGTKFTAITSKNGIVFRKQGSAIEAVLDMVGETVTVGGFTYTVKKATTDGVTIYTDADGSHVSGLNDGDKVTVAYGGNTTTYEVSSGKLLIGYTGSSSKATTKSYTLGSEKSFTAAWDGTVTNEPTSTGEAGTSLKTGSVTVNGTDLNSVVDGTQLDARGNVIIDDKKSFATINETDGALTYRAKATSNRHELNIYDTNGSDWNIDVSRAEGRTNVDAGVTRDGAGNIIATNPVDDAVNVITGSERSEVAVYSNSDSSIKGGSGNLTATVGGRGDHHVTAGNGSRNELKDFGTGENVLTGGTGKNVFQSTNENGKLVAGSGKNTFKTTGNVTNKVEGFTYGRDEASIDSAISDLSKFIVGDGTINYGGKASSGELDLSSGTGTGNIYAVTILDSTGKKTNVGWTGEEGGTIDASSETRSLVLIGNQNGDAKDILMGGKGRDVIYAGAGDSVTGGEGRNELHLNGSGIAVGFGRTGAKDEVTGFKSGFDKDEADSILLMDAYASEELNLAFDGKNAVLKNGNTRMTLDSIRKNSSTNAAELLIGGAKVAAVEKGNIAIVTDADYADVYFGTGSAGIDFKAVYEDLTVDLSDTSRFRNIGSVTGGAGNTLLMGGGSKVTLVSGGGNTSLWGGTGNAMLVGSKDSKDEFFFFGESGRDTVSGFTAGTDDTSDVLNLYGSAITDIRGTAKGVEISTTEDSKVIIQGLTANDKLQWVSGDSKGVAKIGSKNEANSFTYEADVTNYFGGNKIDTLKISGESSTVWLDRVGSSIEIIDASGSTGNNLLAGSSESQTIKGGRGNNSLWGGAGGNDILTGGSGHNEFYFGIGEGNDIITQSNDTDKVMLYNVKVSDLDAAGMKDGNMVIALKDGSSLTIQNYDRQGATTFQLADGTYSYDKSAGTWKESK